MEKELLKELLTTIKSNNYEVPEGIRPVALSSEMMNYIGDPDAELRDDLVLSILTKWIINDTLTLEEIQQILTISLDENHLFYHIKSDSDSVFTRTFSVLIVAIVIYKHREYNFLAKNEVINALEKVLAFYNQDKDVRGYINEKGWAHGAAHGADALDEFARCNEIGYEELKNILKSIYNKINISYYGYIHEEDERMVTVVLAILERNIMVEFEVIEWLKSFGNISMIGEANEDLVNKINVRNFLRSLYFRLMDDKKYKLICSEIETLLENIKFVC